MKICLNAETYQNFLDHRPKESVGYSKLNNAVNIGSGIINNSDEYWIDCSEQEVDAVLTWCLSCVILNPERLMRCGDASHD